jgi:cyclophilin family peptidyl-prolyl cis-trans isomerase
MPRLSVALGLLFAGLVLPPTGFADQAKPAPPNPAQTTPVLVLDTTKGLIEMEVFPTEAPTSVAHVLALVGRNFYRGLRVHWAQPGVIQFGDPQTRDMTKLWSWGSGGSGRPVNVAETSKRPFVRGSVGLAYRKDQPPTAADSQIFILRTPNPELNGKYAMLGRVTRGLDVLDKLAERDMIRRLALKTDVP